MLGRIYNEKGLIPIDEKIWREILQNQGINADNLRDPWDNPLQAEFRYDRSRLTFELWSPGADKIAKTYDDLTVYENIYGYFHPTGKIIDSAITEYNQRTGNFVTTYQTLRDEMLWKNIDLDKLRDPWGNPYRFEFLINRTNFIISIKTNGANGKPEEFSSYQSDDAEVWSHSADYFAYTRAKVKESFEKYVTETKNIPNNEAELKTALRENGFDLDKNTDVYGRPYYIQNKKDYRLARFYRVEGNRIESN
ncbi:MAG: hypothetical protein HC846_10915 [Blastocatellia bacterium]|nr:hypothetical protein [Blastocatellia bacterium]